MSCRGFANWDSGAALHRPTASNVGDVIGPRKLRQPRRISSIEWQRKRKIHKYCMSFSFASCRCFQRLPKDQDPRRNSKRKSHFTRWIASSSWLCRVLLSIWHTGWGGSAKSIRGFSDRAYKYLYLAVVFPSPSHFIRYRRAGSQLRALCLSPIGRTSKESAFSSLQDSPGISSADAYLQARSTVRDCLIQ